MPEKKIVAEQHADVVTVSLPAEVAEQLIEEQRRWVPMNGRAPRLIELWDALGGLPLTADINREAVA
jgi:hypothetical protein